MKCLKRKLVLSTLCLSLFGTCNMAIANEAISPLSYDTIIGESNSFIDLKSDRFLLNQGEWFEIQAYVEAALGLPTNKTAMKSMLTIPDDIEFNDFQALVNEYKKVYDTAYEWKSDIYPKVVDLSLGLANYSDIHSAFFAPLLDALVKMRDNNDWTTVETNRQVAIQLLKTLQSMASTQQQKVEDVKSKLLTFSTNLSSQKKQLDSLKDSHSRYLDDDGSATKELIKTQNAKIAQLNDDYDHYVTVAATAVTYAWCPLVAGPIMGVYGSKAEDARMERNRIQGQMAGLQATLSLKEKTYASYQRSTNSINMISEDIQKVIPHINKLKTQWQAIGSDFETVISLLNGTQGPAGIENAMALVASITTNASLGQVQDKWADIADKARVFVQNAYIVPAK